mmetsp:Transcript_21154/g.26013  ORF Transcript_21154/g.26013 Transcript_21154/m.26013 type:complete len:132 (-) Transcript_21154:964-1359(-)
MNIYIANAIINMNKSVDMFCSGHVCNWLLICDHSGTFFLIVWKAKRLHNIAFPIFQKIFCTVYCATYNICLFSSSCHNTTKTWLRSLILSRICENGFLPGLSFLVEYGNDEVASGNDFGVPVSQLSLATMN